VSVPLTIRQRDATCEEERHTSHVVRTLHHPHPCVAHADERAAVPLRHLTKPPPRHPHQQRTLCEEGALRYRAAPAVTRGERGIARQGDPKAPEPTSQPAGAGARASGGAGVLQRCMARGMKAREVARARSCVFAFACTNRSLRARCNCAPASRIFKSLGRATSEVRSAELHSTSLSHDSPPSPPSSTSPPSFSSSSVTVLVWVCAS
jgi:hypothetical protein